MSIILTVKGMRESNEIDYGILGPDIILDASDVYCNLGIAYSVIGERENSIQSLLDAWDRRRIYDTDQSERTKRAFLVLL